MSVKGAMLTMQLLLRIEKYPHRMNFNKGILEARRLHYKHLSKLLVSRLAISIDLNTRYTHSL